MMSKNYISKVIAMRARGQSYHEIARTLGGEPSVIAQAVRKANAVDASKLSELEEVLRRAEQ